VDQNLKYVGSEQKIYGSRIIYKINLKGRIVFSATNLPADSISISFVSLQLPPSLVPAVRLT
jgi:hypothetical protein